MKIKIKRTVWPSMFTLANMFLGYLAIMQIFQGASCSAEDPSYFHRKIILAGWLVFIGSILDGLDGKVARLIHGSSDFGVEIDSLADLLTFVITPSIMIYFVYANDIAIVGVAISFLYVIFGTIRLARFNVIAHRLSPTHFIGLPSPLAAITAMSIPMFSLAWFDHPGKAKIVIPFMIILGFLMVSNITFKKFSHFSLRKDSSFRRDTLIVLINLILTIIYREKILLILTALTVIANILSYWKKTNVAEDEFELDEEEEV